MVVVEKTHERRVATTHGAQASETLEPRPAAIPVRHPISRWYLMPLARAAARALARSALTRSTIRPTHITLAGLVFAATAVGILLWLPATPAMAAVFVLAAWFCDRLDGLLARMTGTATAWGGWLDANVDELVDVATQTALAAAAASLSGSQLPWLLLAAFLAGKYLFMFGLGRPGYNPAIVPTNIQCNCRAAARPTLLRRLYHLPADADVRVHLLILALVTGCLTAELAVVAVYYNFRWIVRYPLVARRLGGVR